MKYRITLLFAFALAFTELNTLADDRKAILGAWKGTLPGEQFGEIELVITPTTITGRNLTTGRSLGEGTYEIDPEKGTIDAHGIADPFKGKLFVGLYSLEGDTLKWVSNGAAKKRPTDLVHRPDKDQFLMVLQRQ
jgi:uncharacterized protein (TIGR03067 family)